jgi:hypothetical protein
MRHVLAMMRRFLASAVFSIVFTITSVTIPAHAQPSTAPPSSLPTTPLSPNTSTQDGIASCELCRNLEGRPGSDLKPHRRHIDKDLHAHKKAKGISKSSKRSLRNQLPHRKLEEGDNQREE